MVEEESTPLWAARLEGKVDLTLAHLEALSKNVADHETRLRTLETVPARLVEHSTDLQDHEGRIRVMEARKTLSWTGVGTALLVLAAVVAILADVIPRYTT